MKAWMKFTLQTHSPAQDSNMAAPDEQLEAQSGQRGPHTSYTYEI